MIRTEVDRLGGLADPPSQEKIEALLAEVRRRGLARIAGALTPGINAVSAPVFDHAGNIILAITVIGHRACVIRIGMAQSRGALLKLQTGSPVCSSTLFRCGPARK